MVTAGLPAGEPPAGQRPAGQARWGSRRTRRVLLQAGFAALLLLFLAYVVSRALTLGLGFGFLNGRGGFAISHQFLTGYDGSDSRLDAYLVGVFNTVRLVAVGLALATVLGVVAGVARLSGNWLVSRLAAVYVEVIRNTPLLVQIVFWYTAVLLQLPKISEGRALFDVAFLSNRALAVPWPEPRGQFALWLALLVAAAAAAWTVRRRRARREERTGQTSRPNAYGAATFALLAVVGFLAAGSPLELDVPELLTPERGAQEYAGGMQVTPEFAALLLALVVYTGSFIAEIVRGSIQSLPAGQTEAAQALGLGGYQRMTLVILPQALRTMIPPLTNQYLNLAKNSSLAVVIAYPELVFVGRTLINNAGHAVSMFVIIMLTYQSMSLLIAAAMNALNRRVQMAGR